MFCVCIFIYCKEIIGLFSLIFEILSAEILSIQLSHFCLAFIMFCFRVFLLFIIMYLLTGQHCSFVLLFAYRQLVFLVSYHFYLVFLLAMDFFLVCIQFHPAFGTKFHLVQTSQID